MSDTEIEMNGLKKSFVNDLFGKVEAHQWEALPVVPNFAEFSEPNENGLNKTILHCACNEGKSLLFP